MQMVSDKPEILTAATIPHPSTTILRPEHHTIIAVGETVVVGGQH